MLLLLSPAKSLDFERPVPPELADELTRPQFVSRSNELIELLREKTVPEIQALMDLSEPLAQLNAERYAAWRPRFTPHNARPAVLAFDGDVYGGLDAASLAPDDLRWAQSHVLMLSGLYGVLRPLDRMQAYRLEMGTRLPNARGESLYAYWGDDLARHVTRRARETETPVVVNLASQEYFHAVDRPALKLPVIECQFEDWKDGRYKIISFFAKRARGLMARFAIEQRVTEPEALKAFAAEGYAFEPSVSSATQWVFRRRT
ncbi:peroxide stress protein YaaA [Roseateles paludis]|uniref:UPF0246 protein ABDJ85_12335 n=1 Tax=Roseateles paludis TaxID=3145238 RepID=A0ABV0G3F2_9BURK